MRSRLGAFVYLLVPMVVDCSASSGGEAQTPAQRAPVVRSAPDAARAAQVVLSPAGHKPVRVRVEVVHKHEDRQRGLMFRKQLAPDAGMLFVFEAPQQLTFWMRNTYLPLDMVFITADMSVLGVVENAQPLTDDKRSVPGLSRYVLEVNAGFARRHGIVSGTVVRFADLPPEALEVKP